MNNKITCPYRVSNLGPWKYEENLDNWEMRGPNKCCSFCGSIHPEEFIDIIDKIIAKEDGYEIYPADNGCKIYVIQPGINNGTKGGIKFHTYHMSELPEGCNEKYLDAVRISHEKAEERSIADREELLKLAEQIQNENNVN